MTTTQQLLSNLRSRAHQRRRIISSAKRLRVAAGVTLREAGAACGVSHTAIAAWETGQYLPSGPHLDDYTAFLDALCGDE